MKTYRVWVNQEDYGTMSEKAANQFAEHHRLFYPNETVQLEEVDPDAPTFLPANQAARRDE